MPRIQASAVKAPRRRVRGSDFKQATGVTDRAYSEFWKDLKDRARNLPLVGNQPFQQGSSQAASNIQHRDTLVAALIAEDRLGLTNSMAVDWLQRAYGQLIMQIIESDRKTQKAQRRRNARAGASLYASDHEEQDAGSAGQESPASLQSAGANSHAPQPTDDDAPDSDGGASASASFAATTESQAPQPTDHDAQDSDGGASASASLAATTELQAQHTTTCTVRDSSHTQPSTIAHDLGHRLQHPARRPQRATFTRPSRSKNTKSDIRRLNAAKGTVGRCSIKRPYWVQQLLVHFDPVTQVFTPVSAYEPESTCLSWQNQVGCKGDSEIVAIPDVFHQGDFHQLTDDRNLTMLFEEQYKHRFEYDLSRIYVHVRPTPAENTLG